jgi:RNA polymerase sigma-70 factor, ECF subfamily
VITSPKKYQGENLSDDELMEALVKREPSALEYIYRRYKLLLRAVIMSVSHDETDADDVLTDVLQQLWDQGDRYISNGNGLRGLLVTLARRRAFDRLRRRAAYTRATENLRTDSDNPLTREIASESNRPESRDLFEFLQRVLRELPRAQKEVIDLTFFKGMSQRQIATERQISLGTVKTRLSLARRKLYNYLLPLQGKI